MKIQDFYSPMLFGVRNTKVLIPQEMLETENYSYEEWYLIFLHELTHQKKHDLWYKRFLQIIRDVYWFCIPNAVGAKNGKYRYRMCL